MTSMITDHNALRAKALAVIAEFNKYMIGLPHVGELLMSSAIQGGLCHFWAEGVPGVGKTRSVEVFVRLIGGKHFIIQGTPDLMPKDITGSEFYDKVTGQWKARWTDLADANLIFIDEINRCDTRTQSALLAPMSEGRVTIQTSNLTNESSTRYLHPVNLFMATQNPLEQEGTNPLPEAQHDRFLVRAQYTYPSAEAEDFLLANPHLASRDILNEITAKISLDEILEARAWVKANIKVSERFRKYMLTVLRATRRGSPEYIELGNRHPRIRPILDAIENGISVRASIALLEACRVRAFLFGKNEDGVSERNFVMPEDLKALAADVMCHRMIIKPGAEGAMRRVKGDASIATRWASNSEYPTDGSITRQQVYDRLERPGVNPITAQHVVDALLTHLDHVNTYSDYSR